MTAAIIAEAWERAITLFHKRHLIAHKLGVADQEYVDRSGDRDEHAHDQGWPVARII